MTRGRAEQHQPCVYVALAVRWAIVDCEGKLWITDAFTDLTGAGTTPVDAKTIDDVAAHLRQTRKD